MVKFELRNKISTLESALGKEPISMELSELELLVILKSMSRWNKKLYLRIKKELIDEMVKENYDLFLNDTKLVKIKCKNCGKEMEV